MDDRALRELERRARAGDADAADRLGRARDRARGADELEALGALWTELVGLLEERNADRSAERIEVDVVARAALVVCDAEDATSWTWLPAAAGVGPARLRALIARHGEDVAIGVEDVALHRVDEAGGWELDAAPVSLAVPGTCEVVERAAHCPHGEQGCCDPERRLHLRLLDDRSPAADLAAWVGEPDVGAGVVLVPARGDVPAGSVEEVWRHGRVRTTRAVLRAWAVDALGASP